MVHDLVFLRARAQLEQINLQIQANLRNKTLLASLKLERNQLEEVISEKLEELEGVAEKTSDAINENNPIFIVNDTERVSVSSFFPAESISTIPQSSSFPLLPQTISVAPENPSCLCGFPSIEFVSKQPQSMGRSFFKCCQQEKDLSCNFFQWKDLDDSPEKFGGSAGANRSTERNPLQELQRRFGHRQFRGGQRECIEAALEARDVYCLMPTGKK